MDNFKEELDIQKQIAYTAGVLQGDITVKTLLESLAEGVVIVNDIGRIILINKRMSEMTGFGKHEVIGESLNIFIPEEMHGRHLSNVKKFFEDPRIRPMGIELELVAKRKDNSTFPVEISLSFLDSETGRLGVGFITDVSSRKKIEEDLKKRNLELDNFAHTVAHDLNASLSGIVGISELLIDTNEETSQETKNDYLSHIAQSGRKMSSVINELLIFASLKKEDINVEKVNINIIVESALKRLKFQVENLDAKVHVQQNMFNCSGYSAWVEEIFFNYLSNALKYGGTPPLIEVFCEKLKDGFVKYSVRDYGEGLNEDFQNIVFEDKSKIKDKLSKGFGLGLAIVKRIVEKLDGYVMVESEVGKGSTFSFCLKE